jgi:triosephosphate isomerase
LVAGNWKMHGSRVDNARLIEGIASRFPAQGVDCVVCPPAVYLPDIARLIEHAEVDLRLGAQDCSAEPMGAFTGEVSAAMLRDVGCQYVIVGHSERRQYWHEDDHRVARKFAAAVAHGLTPILCVGEQLEERQAGHTFDVVARQLDAVLKLSGPEAMLASVIAYEPCWAIGTGLNATPEQAQEVHAFIRSRVGGGRANDAKLGSEVRILYGGSVKPGNAVELFSMPDVDGGLIGGASLKAEDFWAIVAAAGR